jgi:hypothetical protein
MKGVSVLDRVVPARRDCVHITGKLPPDGLKHEPTMEDDEMVVGRSSDA